MYNAQLFIRINSVFVPMLLTRSWLVGPFCASEMCDCVTCCLELGVSNASHSSSPTYL